MPRRPSTKSKPRRAKPGPTKARPDPREQRKQDRARRTRNAILDATAEVITRVGAAGTTMELVAQQAGYSVGSLYNYFKSKDALLHSMALKLIRELSELLARPLPTSLTARQRTEALVLRQLEHVERSRGWILALVQEHPQPARADEVDLSREEHLAYVERVTELLATHIRDAIAEGAVREVDPRLGAVFISSTLKGLLIDWAQRGGEGSATDLAPAVVSLVFDGIGARPALPTSG